MGSKNQYGPRDLKRLRPNDRHWALLVDVLWRELSGLYFEKFLSVPADPDDPKQQFLKGSISDDIDFGQYLGQDHLLEGNRSAAFGQGAVTKSFMEIVLGAYNLIPEGQNAEEWIPTDLLLTLGNGPDKDHRSNVFEIFKNGLFRFYKRPQIWVVDHWEDLGYSIVDSLDIDVENFTIVLNIQNATFYIFIDGMPIPIGCSPPGTSNQATPNADNGTFHTHQIDLLVQNSIVIDQTCKAAELENDRTAPGRNMFYGTRHVIGRRDWLKFQYGTSTEVEQVNHALAVGNLIGLIGGVWRNTIATSLESACTVGFVYELIHSPFAPTEHYFCYCTYGRINNAQWDVPDFEIGKKYYLSNTVAGAVMVEPETWNEGDIVQYIGTGTKDGLEVNIGRPYIYHAPGSVINNTYNYTTTIINNTTIVNIGQTPAATTVRVYLNGVRQHPSAYTVIGTTIVFVNAPENGDEVQVFYEAWNADSAVSEVPSGSCDGSNKDFTLEDTPDIASLNVFLNGILQHPSRFTVAGKVISFLVAPFVGDRVLTDYRTASASGKGYNVEPTGSINGANTDFTLPDTPTSGTEKVYLNGVRQAPGIDYTIAADVITFTVAPLAGDWIICDYEH